MSASRSSRKTSSKAEERSPAELARAERDTLDTAQQQLLEEALKRGELVRATMENAVEEYGVWLFDKLFDKDSTQVLESRAQLVVWRVLLASADTSKLRLLPSVVEGALLCAAYDQRLNSDAWRALNLSRKTQLLRLADEKLIRKGAQHVINAKLTIRTTRENVTSVLTELGEQTPRRISVGGVKNQLAQLHERYGAKAVQRQFELVARKLEPEQREELRGSLEGAVEVLQGLLERLGE